MAADLVRREVKVIAAAAAWPSQRMRSRATACGVIGVLMPHAQDNPVGPPRIAELLQELELLGWTALNVEIDVRLGRTRRPPSRITPPAWNGRIRSSSAICYVTLRSKLMMAPQETFVQRDQHRIYDRDHPGVESAIILMHGFPDNVHLYDRLSLPLAAAPGRAI
jgi:hypothetical protein